ncbi:hypothetical protein Fcan01_11600 [Folsomia candida]|uniref:Uncharacterized protein n=1 Tax=Folsomia candida TaxID=158441 RepID=A0A226E965_FOLCA|nr:hypothetical protein Fcan01_11600 [Folsomia candida]
MHIRLISDYKSVFIPVMPRLRGFRIAIYGASESTGCKYMLPQLQFKTENVAKCVKIVYAKQFPVLHGIRVGLYEKVRTQEDRETHFETIANFLYGSFLSGENGDVCETLGEIDVPIPTGDRFKLRGERVWSGLRCGFGGATCTCWEWEDSAKFLDRIATTFPNVRYSFGIDEMRRKMRHFEVQKWIESGIKLGVLETSGDIGRSDERNVEIEGMKVRLVESEEAACVT